MPAKLTKKAMIEAGRFHEPWKCWAWDGATTGDGYGRFTVSLGHGKAKKLLAHRYSYEYHVEDLQPSMVIDHLCYNRSCWNPYHLRQTTQAHNGMNRDGLNANNASGYRGVSYDKRRGMWRAYINLDKRHKHLGMFRCPTAAGLCALSAYNDYLDSERRANNVR